jgi:hypothetical protein
MVSVRRAATPADNLKERIMITADFVLAGKAVFTIDNGKGTHYTFRVSQSKPEAGKRPAFFISLQTAGERNGRYIGLVNEQDLTVKLTRNSKFTEDDTTTKVARFALNIVAGRKVAPVGYDILPSAKCGRCGRKLTQTESIIAGIGPECAGKVTRRNVHGATTTTVAPVTAATVEARMQEIEAEGDRAQTVRESAPEARPDRVRCDRCAGTGQFITRVENGRPTGPGGECYRCGGKGYQTVADSRRNYGYDNFYARVSL